MADGPDSHDQPVSSEKKVYNHVEDTLLQALLDGMDIGVAIYEAVDGGQDFVFREFNGAAQKIDKISREAVIGRRVTEVFPAVAEFGLLGILQKVWKTGMPERHPVMLYKDQRIRGWRESSVYRLPSGEVVAVYSDRTAMKELELEHQRSERELSVKNRIAEVFLTIADEDMYTEVLNIVLAAFDSRLGVFGFIDEKGALVVPSMTRHVWDRCQVADKTITFPHGTWGDSAWPRAIREKRAVWSNEPSAMAPAGHVPVRRHISMPIVHKGEVIGLFQVANRGTEYAEEDVLALRSIADYVAPLLHARLERDLWERERRLAEEALRASGAKLRGILDATRESIWMFAPEGVVLLANSTAIARIGKPAQEIIGRHLNDLIPPELARTRLERIREVVLTARPVEFEDVRAGMHFHHSFYPVLDGAGAVASVVSFSRDITECKRAEREIRRQNEVLEPCIRERPWLGKDQIMNYSSALSIGEKLMEVKYEH